MKLTQVFATIVTVSDSFHKETTSVPICILNAMDKFWAHAILLLIIIMKIIYITPNPLKGSRWASRLRSDTEKKN